MMEQSLYEGRKGQKRLKALERHIETVKAEFETGYEKSHEMIFLESQIQWENTARLIFAMAMRDVHLKWNGIRDYGFLRLCRKWVETQGIGAMTNQSTIAMIKNILPADMCSALAEEIAEAEADILQ